MAFDLEYVEKYIPEFCNRYNYPDEARESFMDVLKRAAADEELKESFFAPAKAYAAGKKIAYRKNLSGNDGVCKRLAEKLNVSPYTADFVYCLTLIPYLQERYEQKGLDLQIFYDGMDDFRCKLWECKRVYDVWGSFVAGWFGGWFILDRFAFGRLQYEPRKHIWIHCKLGENGEKRVRLFQKFLNMHIPSSGPLTPESVEDSYKRAYAFFRERGYAEDIVFHTDSWLLSPDHEKMFSPDSNIVRFVKCFRVVRVGEQKGEHDFWRIYNRPYNAAAPDYSGETTMQKKYAELLSAGGNIKSGAGVFIYDGKKFYK